MPTPTAHPLAGRVFRGRDAVAAGRLTARQLQGPRWRRLLQGGYADAELPLDHGPAIAGARLLIPRSAAIAGRSAAWLRGADVLAAGTDPVDILVPRRDRFGPIAGLRIHTTGRLDSDDVELDNGLLLLTRPGRTAVDIALWAPDIVEAVWRWT